MKIAFAGIVVFMLADMRHAMNGSPGNDSSTLRLISAANAQAAKKVRGVMVCSVRTEAVDRLLPNAYNSAGNKVLRCKVNTRSVAPKSSVVKKYSDTDVEIGLGAIYENDWHLVGYSAGYSEDGGIHNFVFEK